MELFFNPLQAVFESRDGIALDALFDTLDTSVQEGKSLEAAESRDTLLGHSSDIHPRKASSTWLTALVQPRSPFSKGANVTIRSISASRLAYTLTISIIYRPKGDSPTPEIKSTRSLALFPESPAKCFKEMLIAFLDNWGL